MRRVLNIASVLGMLAFLVLTPVFLLPKLISQPFPRGMASAEESFLMLWSVETTEAGSGGLNGFLEKRALNYEKTNKGVFVVVKKLTPEQLVLQLENGNLPDIISFGLGVGELIESKLVSYTGRLSVRTELAEAGKTNNQQKAVAWSMGGYLLAARSGVLESGQSVLAQALNTGAVGKKGASTYSLTTGGVSNVGLLALVSADKSLRITGKTNALNPNIHAQTQYEAYAEFVSSSASNILLGSQRDYARLINREKNGNMLVCRYEFLSGFSDIVNYMGITTSDTVKHKHATRFIEYLTSGGVQSMLTSIGMFAINGLNYHTESGYREYENAINKPIKTINVFTSHSKLDELKSLCLSALNGQDTAFSKLQGYI